MREVRIQLSIIEVFPPASICCLYWYLKHIYVDFLLKGFDLSVFWTSGLGEMVFKKCCLSHC